MQGLRGNMPELIGKGKQKECLDSMYLGNFAEHGRMDAGGHRLRHFKGLSV
jgi:hypothetical protein